MIRAVLHDIARSIAAITLASYKSAEILRMRLAMDSTARLISCDDTE